MEKVNLENIGNIVEDYVYKAVKNELKEYLECFIEELYDECEPTDDFASRDEATYSEKALRDYVQSFIDGLEYIYG